MPAFDPIIVPSFGGGLNFGGLTTALSPNEWTWSDGFIPHVGTAVTAYGWRLVAASGAWRPAGYTNLGMLPAYVRGTGNVMLPVRQTAGPNAIRLFDMNFVGTTFEYTLVGTAPSCPAQTQTNLRSTTVLNNEQFIPCGFDPGGTRYSVLRVNNAGTFQRMDPGFAFSCSLMETTGAHLLAAGFDTTPARVRVSASNDSTTWTLAVSNDADDITLDTIGSINALVRTLEGVLVFSNVQTHLLMPTGGIPPLTGALNAFRGATGFGHRAVATPYGTFFQSDGEFYLQDRPIGKGLFEVAYLTNPFITTSKFAWHPGWSSVVLLNNPTSTTSALYFCVLPTGALWRQTNITRVVDYTVPPSRTGVAELFLLDTGGDTYVEDTFASSAHAGAFVDTKDFAWGSPVTQAYIDRIKVDWEPLTNATTDALDVLAYARDDLSLGLLGSIGMATDYSAQFTLVGTLTGGDSELVVRTLGKYTRFRFRQNSGRVRIRGFTIEASSGGTR